MVCAQVLVLGKVSQAVVVAGAAYHDEATFTKITGISTAKMVVDKAKTGAQVRPPPIDSFVCTLGLGPPTTHMRKHTHARTHACTFTHTPTHTHPPTPTHARLSDLRPLPLLLAHIASVGMHTRAPALSFSLSLTARL